MIAAWNRCTATSSAFAVIPWTNRSSRRCGCPGTRPCCSVTGSVHGPVEQFSLPTEAQWEYACRAGSNSPLWYGDLDTDFSRLANLGDARLSEFALDTYIQVQLVDKPNRYDDWIPKESRFNDGGFVTMPVGSYTPNPWGLCDMHGNVSEWTLSAYCAYPYREDDGRNERTSSGQRVVRGGSWYDRPVRCRSASRFAYAPFQPVFHVGFRVVMLDD